MSFVWVGVGEGLLGLVGPVWCLGSCACARRKLCFAGWAVAVTGWIATLAECLVWPRGECKPLLLVRGEEEVGETPSVGPELRPCGFGDELRACEPFLELAPDGLVVRLLRGLGECDRSCPCGGAVLLLPGAWTCRVGERRPLLRSVRRWASSFLSWF